MCSSRTIVGNAGSIASTAMACVDSMAAASTTNSRKPIAESPRRRVSIARGVKETPISRARPPPRAAASRPQLLRACASSLPGQRFISYRLRSGRASSLSLGKADSRDALYHCSASRIAYVAAGYHGRRAQSLPCIRGLWHIQGGGRPYWNRNLFSLLAGAGLRPTTTSFLNPRRHFTQGGANQKPLIQGRLERKARSASWYDIHTPTRVRPAPQLLPIHPKRAADNVPHFLIDAA